MKIKSIFKNKLIISAIICLLIVLLGVPSLYASSKNNEISEEKTLLSEEKNIVQDNYIYVDIKGAINKPGVYKMKENSIVNDVIKEAGGLKKNGTTKNINLSKILSNEMVIYIFTKNELKKSNSIPVNEIPCQCETIEVNNCIDKTEATNPVENKDSSLININTASKEELMNIPGVGSSKADSIIIYREENKFNTIEDIMNVSGIGESIFAKIKDHITV